MKRRSLASYGATVGDRVFIIAIVAVLAWVTAGRYAARRRIAVPTLQSVTAQSTDEAEIPVPARHLLKEFNTEDLTIPIGHILPGGPAKDGIPSLVEPSVVPVSQAEHLKPGDRVVGVTVGGQSRAYPINVLNWHEVINDRLGATDGGEALPIAVIYCPLCDSVSVVSRRLGDTVYEFGVSGLLYNSNVLLYDRTDQALWSQVGMEAVSGPNAGRSLVHLDNWELTTFGTWKREHPDSTVVGFDTGHRRAYDMNPYARYFQSHRLIFPVEHRDTRLRNKDPVIGIRLGEVTRAYPLAELRDASGGRVRDVLEGQRVQFDIDAESGAIKIVQIPEGAGVTHTFWFAWVAFHPDTEVYEPSLSLQ